MSRRLGLAALARIERHFGLHSGPTTECPTCGGDGMVEPVDGERVGARITHRMALVEAQLLGAPEPPPLVTPDEPMVPCAACRATGRFPKAVADALAALAALPGMSVLEARMRETARRLAEPLDGR